jgi:hypothetical protein
MATYRVTLISPTSFTAEVTFRNGRIETLCDIGTETAALNWVGDRLGEDILPAREA